MMDTKPGYFSRLLPALAERSRSASLSRLGFAHVRLYRHLAEVFSRPYGAAGSFLADPTFEAVFGWAEQNQTMGDLAGNLLDERLVAAMDNPPDLDDERCPERNRERRRLQHPYRFGRERRPYRHQLEAWEILRQETPQSLVVASGTGSGKTECFMVPILDRLVRQQAQKQGRLVGVRALFLYPLNALINSQRERLRAWTDAFGRDIRFCLYNGNTQEHLPANQANAHPNEVKDRKSLRDAPPPILVTNATMLEYMLVRTLDASILERSQGCLEWVVLDEAHTYVGSQAAELALLLRRVLHAFGAHSEQVRFVATSATIGDPDGEAGERLRRFLADAAGVSENRVHLVAGTRAVPSLGALSPRATAPESLDDLSRLAADNDEAQPAPERYAALTAHPMARAIRELFIANDQRNREGGGSGMVASLAGLGRLIHGTAGPFTLSQQTQVLRWLDLLSGTRGADGAPFLPLRAHLFHQTLSGIWACADPGCVHRQGTALDDPDWPFGQVFLEPRQHCPCGSPIYELVACDDCGAPHLVAVQRDGRLLPPRGRSAVDEFELDAEPDEDHAEDDNAEPDDEAHVNAETRVLVVNRPGLPHTGEELIERESRRLVDQAIAGQTLRLTIQDAMGNGFTCPCCEGQDGRRKLMQEFRIGAPFALGVILPTLLEFAPDERCQPEELPYRGRRLLTFNDSRQGTARMAARLQQESERNRVRALVYHLALREGVRQQSAEVNDLTAELAGYESLLTQTAPEGRRFVEQQIKKRREELLALTQPTPIPFNDLANHLADQGQDFERMLRHYREDISHESFAGPTGSLTLARMFLVREFGRRPKRLNSLESMGLVAVCYPRLQQVTTAPAAGFTLDEWRALLKIALDFFVRGGGSLAVDDRTRHWLGTRFPRTWLVERDRDVTSRGERRWLRAKRSGLRSPLVRLLSHVLNADIETAYGQDAIDRILTAAWTALTEHTGILKVAEGGRRTLPLDALAFTPMTRAWVCPVTRRFLDCTLKGITPYLPVKATDATARCEQVQIPLYDQPFGGDAEPMAQIVRARRWLGGQREIEQLRERGLWQSLNDRVIELAPYFVAAEHSAQQPSDRLDRYEKLFKRGELNLLSCSTTMEMGIDIGGIAMVAMNNVPPHPANYLQRAGRAGRRQEARSLTITLCKSNPHDQLVFAQTDWPFATPLPAPRVALDSSVIVQRHLNALVLSHFLKEVAVSAGQDASKLTCGWFFGAAGGTAPAQHLIDQCLSPADAGNALARGLPELVKGSPFEGSDPVRLVRRVGETMQVVVEAWLPEWEALCRQEEATRGDGENPANKAVKYQKGRMEGEYLLRELADQGFLPAYGFPTHIAAFDNLTAARAQQLWQQLKQQRTKGIREDNRFRRRELANRDSVTALREYAPGAEVVMDGLVYRSAGITLNWKIPATESDAREVQAIRYAWRCKQCGASGSTRLLEEARHCAECGAAVPYHPDLAQSATRTFLEPSGFAVDFYSEPHNDVSTQAFIPVEPAWVSADGEWLPLPNPHLGRFRISTRGHLFHQSNGLHGKGYAVCLLCGRAAPMGDDPLPEVFTKPHTRLRGDKRGGRETCPGSDQPWAIKPVLTLGHETHTDVLELQLKTLDGAWLNDQTKALTLAVALRDALAGCLGVRADELGCTEKDARPAAGAHCRSILIFDRFAAGYASSAHRYLDRIFHAAQVRLHCLADCDSACPRCVLDFDQRFFADSLDRHAALAVLTPEWLDALKPPRELAFFGPASRPEYADLGAALLRVAGVPSTRAVRLFGAGGADCDLGLSPLRHLAYRLAGLDHGVEVVLDQGGLAAMDDDDRTLLASLADHPRIRVFQVPALPVAGGGQILAEVVGADRATRWGVTDAAARVAGPDWAAARPLMMAGDLPPLTDGREPLTGEHLRPKVRHQGDLELTIQHELDGPLQGFGQRLWTLVQQRHPATARLFADDRLEVCAVAYHDRYLVTPLAVALLLNLIEGLRATVGRGRWGDPPLTITTMTDAAPTERRPARQVWCNWPELNRRDTVIADGFDYLGMAATVNALPRQQTQHGRRLEVGFSAGTVLSVRLDQGISYWRFANGAQGRWDTGRFDFDAEPTNQAQTVATLAGQVEGGDQGTQVFVAVRGRG